MRYLVSGANGNIGGRVVEALLARGERPRVLVRDAAKAHARFGDRIELVVGDLGDERAFAAALTGMDALFLLSNGPQLAEHDAAAARLGERARLSRIVKLSALGARSSGQTTAVAEWHARGEAALRAGSVPWTFVQPVGFMSNALAWAPSIRTRGVVRASTGSGRIAMIHPDDIAAVAIEALTTSAYEGRALAITGPQALSYGEMTACIAAAIDKPLAFEPITDAQAHAELLAHGLSSELADALVLLWSEVRAGLVSLMSPEVERVLGREPRSFARWVAENLAAFRRRLSSRI